MWQQGINMLEMQEIILVSKCKGVISMLDVEAEAQDKNLQGN